MSRTIKAVNGGASYDVVVGGKTEYHIDDIKSKWAAHKKYGSGKDFLLKTINEIIQLPEYVDDIKLLTEVLEKIWRLPNKKIYMGIVKSLELNEPIQIAKRNLFWKWKELIESVVILYLGHVYKQNTKQLIQEWSKYVQDNSIDTSSITLWSLFNSDSPWYGKYLADVVGSFQYVGYCPAIPNERMQLLMQFPIDALFVGISIPTVDILKIKEQIEHAAEVHDMAISDEIDAIFKGEFTQDLNKFVETFIKFNIKLQPYLAEQEEHAIKSAQTIDAVANEIHKFNQKLAKQIGRN